MNLLLRPFAITLLFLSLASGAGAQSTFTVTSTASTGLGTLDWAIVQAEFTPGPDLINFSPTLAGKKLTVDFEFTVTDDLTIDGIDAPGLVLSGGWDGIHKSARGNRIFVFPVGPNRRVRIANLVMRDGNAGSQSTDTGGVGDELLSNGGLIFLNGGELELESVTLMAATAHDGGLVRVNGGTLRASRSSFALGRARDDGGAVYVSTGASFTATNCTFVDNITGYGVAAGADPGGSPSENHEGAAIYATGALSFEHCTFTQNLARHGGVVQALDEVRLARNLFANNAHALDRTDVFGTGELEGLTGAPLSLVDGNFSPDQIDGFTRVANDRIRLATPRYTTNQVLVALDCGSDLYGALRSSGTDQMGNIRGGTSEPGALETYDCVDTNNNGLVDAADPDDDGDGMTDTTEHSFADRITSELATTLGTGDLVSGTTYTAGPTALTYTTAVTGGKITVAGRSNVQGEAGLSILVNNWISTDRAALEIHFEPAVYGLSFKLGDLDVANANLHEQVDIQLEYEGQTLGLTPADVTLGANVEQLGNRFAAKATLPIDGNTDPRGNVELIDYANPVSTLRLVMSPGHVGGLPTFANVVLTQLHFRDPITNDHDGDGLIAALDLDTDGDGLPDRIEAQTSGGFAPEAFDVVPVDTDGDGVPDFLDDDSDDDGEPDRIEGHDSNNDGIIDARDTPVFGTGEAIGRDSDRDGLDDGFDDNPSVFGTGEVTSLQGIPENDGADVDFDWRDDAANLGAFAWDDTNRDGIRDANEPALSGLTFEVYRVSDHTLRGSYITDAEGRIFIADFGGFGPPPDAQEAYYLQVVAFGGFDNPTSQFRGNDPRLDSDLDPGTMRTRDFSVTTDAPQLFIGVGLTDDPQPVDLHDLAIRTDEHCQSTLVWQVGAERQVDRYEVERRADSGAWSVEEIVDAQGASRYEQRLQSQDGVYRLRIVESNGDSRASDTLRIAPCAPTLAERLTAAPNPVVRGEDIRIATSQPRQLVELIDLSGRPVARPGHNLTDEYGELRMPTQDLPRGIYVLRADNQLIRIVIQ